MSFAAPGLSNSAGQTKRHDCVFAEDVIRGLSASQKYLQAKYFYDARGSELFEMICALEEYYPTRTETRLLKEIAPELAAQLPAEAVLVEFGSGASAKSKLLIDAMAPESYVPIDISISALEGAVRSLYRTYPGMTVRPLHADFTTALKLPKSTAPHVGFFPGSTIGNFTHAEAVQFMRNARNLLGNGAHFILGADLIKEEETLIRAYDDSEGVTAAFNLNLLVRINRELEGNVDLRVFHHRAIWNAGLSRIEMHLVSTCEQSFEAAGQVFTFGEGETIHTENCHKFSRESIETIAQGSGWRVREFRQSEAPAFAVILLEAV